MTKEEAVLKAHHMYAYETSEQSDLENHDFDAYGKVFMMFVNWLHMVF